MGPWVWIYTTPGEEFKIGSLCYNCWLLILYLSYTSSVILTKLTSLLDLVHLLTGDLNIHYVVMIITEMRVKCIIAQCLAQNMHLINVIIYKLQSLWVLFLSAAAGLLFLLIYFGLLNINERCSSYCEKLVTIAIDIRFKNHFSHNVLRSL